MGIFSGDVIGEFIGAKNLKLLEDLTYKNNKLKVTAKAGMLYDMASIPKMFWRVIGSPYIGKYRRAATLHDALYTSQGLKKLNKKQVDKLFLEMMKVEGVSLWKRQTMYWAVRLGGKSAWDSIEKDGYKYCEIKFLRN